MNQTEIDQLKAYIREGKQPLLRKSAFKICKRVIDQHKDAFTIMANNLEDSEGIKRQAVENIINHIGTANEGRRASAFAFAVFLDATRKLNFDIREVLPKAEFDKCEKDDVEILTTIGLGLTATAGFFYLFTNSFK